MLLEWKSCEMIEMNIQKDHVHLIVSVPPKLSISELMGILKGKTAIKIFKSYPQLRVSARISLNYLNYLNLFMSMDTRGWWLINLISKKLPTI